MNNRERFSFLLRRYINNNCSTEEFDELFSLVNLNENKPQLLKELRMLWEDSNPEQQHTNEQWDTLYASMMQSAKSTPEIRLIRKRSMWTKIAVAAGILITISTGLLFVYRSELKVTQDQQAQSKNDPAPGGNKAVLTLSNGTKIVLDGTPNGEVASQKGVEITKTADGQLIYALQDTKLSADEKLNFNTIETPKGGQYEIIMPDGSKVWLNAASSLKYPVSFKGKERKVELTGEAYFEVAKNKHVPFKVITGNQIVEVLGTHFNINSYEDEPGIKTTLLEGSVKVSFTGSIKGAMLMPGQQSVFQSSHLDVNTVDTEEAVAWKNGYFAFDKSNLEHIMRQVSRWYNVDVVYQNDAVKQQIFSGNVSRFEKASRVLSILELTGLIHFKIEGRRITVMP